jgi:hypothetical protein
LALFIANAENPLTARVYVNRIWQWMYGNGLVQTADDFGHLGDVPTHQELLDTLAVDFMANDWSTKRLIRRLAQSSTWRQKSVASELAMQVDPDNRLWHHFAMRRLEAESIRDAMMVAAARFHNQLYGPPTNPPRTNEDSQKRLFSGPVDGLGRRAIYTKITIMEPPRFLALFNQPAPKIPTGKRDVTNTPAQSLALLNDPTVRELATIWGKSMVARQGESLDDRIHTCFDAALSRPASEQELRHWTALVNDLAGLHRVAPEAVMTSEAVWTDVAHTLFNLKEFIYVR